VYILGNSADRVRAELYRDCEAADTQRKLQHANPKPISVTYSHIETNI